VVSDDNGVDAVVSERREIGEVRRWCDSGF